MARVTKEAEVRRDELLDVAFELCVTDGFEGTSVERITNAAGVAKGTFYHYFESKDDLLTQMVRRFGDELFEHLETAMAAVGGNAVERLRTLMVLSSQWKLARLDTSLATVPVLLREENFAFRHRLFNEWFDRTRPLLLGIVEQGATDGTFDVDDAAFTTDIILTIWYDYAVRLWDQALRTTGPEAFADTMLRGADVIWMVQERILGAPEGAIRVVIDEAAMATALAAMYESGVLRNLPDDKGASK